MRQVSVSMITIFISLMMLPVLGYGAVGGQSAVTVDFYAGQHTRQQVDAQQVHIPDGIKPYHVVNVRIQRNASQLPQTGERPLLWLAEIVGLGLLVVLASYRYHRWDSL